MASALNPKRTALLFGFTLALTLMIDCLPVVSRQDWDSRWGPLVPHKTFPGDCGLCHVPARWDKLRADFAFDHKEETGYALEGAHRQAACLRCHNDRGPVQVYVERGCGGCHPDPHASSLGLDCQRCHDQGSWRPTGLIAEHARTRFPLMGVHTITPCETCHTGAPTGDFRGAPTACELCHQADLARALVPDHQANSWTLDCQRCHVPASWLGTDIRHDFFPLTGGHGALDCSQCHTGGLFTGLSQDCYTCHASDYQGAPDHASSGYSQDCTQCHSIAAWSPANFNHPFPLTGGHGGLNCNQCHTGGTFTGLSQDCHSCHASDYQGAPDHVSLGFSQTCEQCHTTAAWDPSTFHHAFPLTGDHNLNCTECHNTGSTSSFSCIDCHDHRQSEADSEHDDVSGYTYASQACYQCHPNGRH